MFALSQRQALSCKTACMCGSCRKGKMVSVMMTAPVRVSTGVRGCKLSKSTVTTVRAQAAPVALVAPASTATPSAPVVVPKRTFAQRHTEIIRLVLHYSVGDKCSNHSSLPLADYGHRCLPHFPSGIFLHLWALMISWAALRQVVKHICSDSEYP